MLVQSWLVRVASKFEAASDELDDTHNNNNNNNMMMMWKHFRKQKTEHDVIDHALVGRSFEPNLITLEFIYPFVL